MTSTNTSTSILREVVTFMHRLNSLSFVLSYMYMDTTWWILVLV
jgi:hypothetical protein